MGVLFLFFLLRVTKFVWFVAGLLNKFAKLMVQ
jgi:hypothetical protein